MKKNFALPLTYILFFFFVVSSSAQVTWEKLFSRKSSVVFRNVVEVPAGGYLIAGYLADSTVSDTDAYAVRMNTAGDTIWTKRINGSNSQKDLFYKVINTSDGGFAFCGYSNNNGVGNEDAWILKMSSTGNIEWTKYWGGTGRDRAQDIVQTSDGGFAITGYTTSPPAAYYDAFLARYSSTGDSLWSKRYGTGGFEDANTLVLHPDGGFVLGGQSTNGTNALDMYMVRTDSSGDTLWTKKFGTVGTDNIEHILRESDGSYILAGGTDGPGLGGNDGYLVKTDSGGVVLWSKNYGGNSQDDFHQVYKTTGGNYILSGTSRSSGPLEPNMWLMKTNSSGDSLWSKTFGGDNHDHGYSAVQVADGGYIFVGYSSSFGFNAEEAYVVKTNNLGDINDYLTYISVATLVQPIQGSCVSNNVQVKVVVRNFGRDTVPSVPVSIQISGPASQTINQTYNGSVRPGELDTLTFSVALDLSIPGTYTFSCTSSNVNDVFPKNNNLTTTITILPYSLPPTSTTSGSRCGTGSVMLNASSPDSIFWYSASSGGTLLGASSNFNTPSVSSTTTYYAQAGFTCPSSRVAVAANVLSAPASPTTGSAQRCGTGSLNLTATAVDPVRWFNTASGGTQVGTGYSFITPSINSTTVYYAEAYNAGCGSARISASAIINSVPANPVTTSSSRCDIGTLTLNATAADPVSWFDASVGGNLVGTGNSFTTPSLSVSTTYYAEASTGLCFSNRISALATVSSQVADPVVVNGSRCGPGIVSLTASSNDILIWYSNASGGSQLGSGGSFVTPFLTSTTTYYVLATNGACPSNYIPVLATVNPALLVSLGPDTLLVSSFPYTLDAGAGFNSYAWSDGSTSQTLAINSQGNYCVTVSNSNSCSASDCIEVQISIGIKDVIASDKYSLYPNPVSDKIYIQFDTDESEALCQFFSMDGQLVSQKLIKNLSHGTAIEYNTFDFAAGVYLMRISTKDWVGSNRIIRK